MGTKEHEIENEKIVMESLNNENLDSPSDIEKNHRYQQIQQLPQVDPNYSIRYAIYSQL